MVLAASAVPETRSQPAWNVKPPQLPAQTLIGATLQTQAILDRRIASGGDRSACGVGASGTDERADVVAEYQARRDFADYMTDRDQITEQHAARVFLREPNR